MSDGVRILVVDDSPATLEVVGRILREQGHEVETAPDVPGAVSRLDGPSVDLVITDFRMPGADGLDLIRHIRENHPTTAVIMLTGFPSIEGAVEAVKGGAEAYLTKPFTQNELIEAVDGVVATVLSRRAATTGGAVWALSGRSDAAKALRAAVDRAAESVGPVLVEARLGDGGPAIVRAIHDRGTRRGRAFAVLDCSLFANGGAEELFGSSETGTGAVERADGGTAVLLDPSVLSEEAQILLLRLLQEKRCVPADEGRPRPVDVRIVAVARRDISRLTAIGRFRRDLLERLAATKVTVPPLSRRPQDVIDLVFAAAAAEAEVLGLSEPTFSDRALDALAQAPWQGGLAELAQVVRSVVARRADGEIRAADLPPHLRFHAVPDDGEVLTLRELERLHIENVLERVGGNKSEASRLLGIDRKTLRGKLQPK